MVGSHVQVFSFFPTIRRYHVLFDSCRLLSMQPLPILNFVEKVDSEKAEIAGDAKTSFSKNWSMVHDWSTASHSTVVLLTMALQSGYTKLQSTKTKNAGHNSKKISTNTTALNGHSLGGQRLSTSWIWPWLSKSKSKITASSQTSLRRKWRYIYTSHRTQHTLRGSWRAWWWDKCYEYSASALEPSTSRGIHIKNFYDRLVRRGYSHSDLLPLLEKAATNAEAFIGKSEEDKAREKRQKDEDSSKRIFLHLKYHPNDPKSSTIQKAIRESILCIQREINPLQNWRTKEDTKYLWIAWQCVTVHTQTWVPQRWLCCCVKLKWVYNCLRYRISQQHSSPSHLKLKQITKWVLSSGKILFCLWARYNLICVPL